MTFGHSLPDVSENEAFWFHLVEAAYWSGRLQGTEGTLEWVVEKGTVGAPG